VLVFMKIAGQGGQEHDPQKSERFFKNTLDNDDKYCIMVE